MTQSVAVSFLSNTIKDMPFNIHRILTDNGAQFTYALLAEHLRPKSKVHPFDALCQMHGIKHKLTKFRHPWTNWQVEVFNKTIKNYTTRVYHYDNITQIRRHMMAFLLVYNFQRPLRALKYAPPYAKITEIYDKNPELFRENPYHKTVGLYVTLSADGVQGDVPSHARIEQRELALMIARLDGALRSYRARQGHHANCTM